MSDPTDSTPRSIALRGNRSLSVGGNSLISRGVEDLAELAATQSSMPSVQTDDIHEAATKGDIEAVRRILNADPAKVDATDDDGWVPLHCAICYDHPRIVELLLTRAANRDARLRGGERRIREAMGDREQFLFYMDIFSGATPLHLAALLGRDANAAHLLSAGAAVCATDDDGFQPMHYAAGPLQWVHGLRNDSSTVLVAERLLAGGADIDARSTRSGITPAHMASRDGHIDMLQCLIRHGADVNARDSNHWTPLHHAAERGQSAEVDFLIQNGALVDAVGHPNGVTPILVASGHGEAQTVTILLQHGATVSERDDLDCTPLHWAAEWGNEETAPVLLDHGADANATDRNGRASLHVAANCCEDNGAVIVKLLLEHGADVNVKDDGDNTPLHYAVFESFDIKVIELLLSHGAEVNARSADGFTPFDLANSAVEEDAAEVIRQHGGVSGTAVR